MAQPTVGSHEFDAQTILIRVEGTLKMIATEIASGSLADALTATGSLHALNKEEAMMHLTGATTDVYATWYIRAKAGNV